MKNAPLRLHAVGALAVAVALVLLGGSRGAVLARSPRAQPHLYQVTVGVNTPYPVLSVNVFAPAQLVVHVGDSVQWTNVAGNEPQTVTFGPVENIPTLITGGRHPEINPLVARPQGGRVVGDTSLNVYSSGALIADLPGHTTRYTFTFRKPGTYLYRSLFHPSSLGEIDVVASNRQATVEPLDRGPSMASALRSTTLALLDSTGSDAHASDVGGHTINVGTGNSSVSINTFAPSGVAILAGQSVMWRIPESSGDLHALVFVPTLSELAGRAALFTGIAPDGGLRINPAYATATLASGSTVTTATVAGRWTSGILYGSSAAYPSQAPSRYTLTFVTPGVYEYVDPFHQGMRGIVNVIAPVPSSTSTPSP